MIELTTDQELAIDSCLAWWSLAYNSNICFGISGYAGTGKTTVLGQIRKKISTNTRVAFCCYTGKAASVLRKKISIYLQEGDTVSTIHSLIYEPVLDAAGEIIDWQLKPLLKCDLIVIDECSMLSEAIFQDLMKFNKPILFTGDSGQLDPVEGKTFGLIDAPFVHLEKIHRQAEDNPIIKVSMMARLEGYIPYENFGMNVAKTYKNNPSVSNFVNNCKNFDNSVILCAYNNTRLELNKKIRKHFGFMSEFPMPGERVICLKNNKTKQIYNGMQGTVFYCEPSKCGKYLDMEIKMDDGSLPYKGPVSKEAFMNSAPNMKELPIGTKTVKDFNGKTVDKLQYADYFDYGYCITVHKSQGSEWERVMLIEQTCKLWDHKKWLYTGVTRAKEQLLIVR